MDGITDRPIRRGGKWKQVSYGSLLLAEKVIWIMV
jgi:hypothetical protein